MSSLHIPPGGESITKNQVGIAKEDPRAAARNVVQPAPARPPVSTPSVVEDFRNPPHEPAPLLHPCCIVDDANALETPTAEISNNIANRCLVQRRNQRSLSAKSQLKAS
jgi:hypothetical protein